MWFMKSAVREAGKLQRREPLHGRLISRSDVKARERRAEHKKKARRRGDAPSNKRYGNCLLGFHCSQKHQPGNRTSIGFPAVAARQQRFSSTAYPQVPVDRLWIKPRPQRQPAIRSPNPVLRGASGAILAARRNNPRLASKVSRRQLSKPVDNIIDRPVGLCRMAESPSRRPRIEPPMRAPCVAPTFRCRRTGRGAGPRCRLSGRA